MSQHTGTRLGASLGVFKAAHDPRPEALPMLLCPKCGETYTIDSCNYCKKCYSNLTYVPPKHDLLKELGK